MGGKTLSTKHYLVLPIKVVDSALSRATHPNPGDKSPKTPRNVPSRSPSHPNPLFSASSRVKVPLVKELRRNPVFKID